MAELTDKQAIDAINVVAELWLEEKGRTAYAVMQATYARADQKKVALPPWARGPAQETPELANIARATLTAILEGSDPDARRWAREALRRVEGSKAQVIDPLTLAIGGTFLIGLVLAARVKKIDKSGVEFYEGLPKELVDLVKAAGTFLKGLT
jgi:hypothetical protein